ncbi:MAG: hypothetical protein ACRCT2_01640, partial [Plesiomonas shigelloides]
MFHWNICVLLKKSLPFKKRWFVNALTAMTWKKRFFDSNLEATVETPEHKVLLEWIQTGRAS